MFQLIWELVNKNLKFISAFVNINQMNEMKFAYVNFKSSQRSCSIRKVFLEILQNSQENTCARVSGLQLYKKKDSGTGVFL